MKNLGIKLLILSLICFSIMLYFYWDGKNLGDGYATLTDTMKILGIVFAVLGLLWPDKLMEQLWDKLTQKISAKIKNKQRNDKNEEE